MYSQTKNNFCVNERAKKKKKHTHFGPGMYTKLKIFIPKLYHQNNKNLLRDTITVSQNCEFQKETQILTILSRLKKD